MGEAREASEGTRQGTQGEDEGARDLWARLAAAQSAHPWRFVLAAALLALASLPWVMQLGLDSDFTALLPEEARSVRDLEVAEGRYGGGASIALALAGDDPVALETYARELGPVLEGLGEPIKTVTWTKAHFREFLSHNRALFADLSFLRTLRDDLEARIEHEHAGANPLFVALDDEEPPTVEELVERVRQEGRARLGELGEQDLYVHPEGGLIVLFIQTNIGSSDVPGAEAFLATLDQLQRDHPAPASVEVHYAGFIPEWLSEHRAISQELVVATLTTILLVLTAIMMFFRRLRAVPTLGLFLVAPVLLTFAIGELVVDDLNTSTAFLGSIIVGNGVNPGILWLARYLEERRGGLGPERALLATHRGVWAGTLTASLAAGVAYASLILTDFRGFHDFGVIGGAGMVFAWLAAFLVLPAIALLWDRWRPLEEVEKKRRSGANFYGRFFDVVVHSAPRAITTLALGLGLASLAIVLFAIRSDPMDYDLSNLRSVREDTQEASGLNERINEFVPRTATGMLTAVLADSAESARRFELALETARDEEGATVGPVHGVFDLLPADQEQKLAVLDELRELIDEIEARLDDEDRAEVAALLPDDLRALAPEDLPLDVRAPFTENDGTVGRVIATEQGTEDGNWQGQYLVDWTESLRHTADEVAASSVAEGATADAFFVVGRPPVFADMLATIWRDGPKAVLFSFLATVLLVVFAFRTGRHRALVLTSLLLGVAWMGAWMWLAGMRINFLNFLAFPITFGNGVDYGVNVLRRYVEERRDHDVAGAVRSSVVGAGGPVALCSLTTIIGYLSLYASANLAINSFGAAMAISEVTCVLAAVVALPAALLWIGTRQRPPRAEGLAPEAA